MKLVERGGYRGELQLRAPPDVVGLGEPFVGGSVGLAGEAGEGFGADDGAGGEVGDRLEHHGERAGGQRLVDAVLAAFVFGGGLPFGGDAHVERCLQLGVVLFEPAVQGAGLEQVGDPQQDLGAVEGLGEEVLGAGGQGPLPDFGGDIGGEDEDGQEPAFGHQALEGLHEGEAVEVRHVQVEQDQVGEGTGAAGDRLVGVGKAVHPADPVVEEAFEQGDVGGQVVDDDHGGVGCRSGGGGRQAEGRSQRVVVWVLAGGHRSSTASSTSRSSSRTSMGLVR